MLTKISQKAWINGGKVQVEVPRDWKGEVYLTASLKPPGTLEALRRLWWVYVDTFRKESIKRWPEKADTLANKENAANVLKILLNHMEYFTVKGESYQLPKPTNGQDEKVMSDLIEKANVLFAELGMYPPTREKL